MSAIPPFFLDATVAIGIGQPNRHWIGTGFLVGRKETTDPERSTVFLITNRHVIKDKPLIYLKFNSKGTTNTKDYPVELSQNGNIIYSMHPNENIDIVAMAISPQVLINDESIFAFFSLGNR